MAKRTPLGVYSGQIAQFQAGDTLSTKAPLVLVNGQREQLQSGDVLAMTMTGNYLATAGPAQPKTLTPGMTFTKSVA